jgi:hypothetical protein
MKSNPIRKAVKGEGYLNDKIDYYKRMDEIKAWPISYKID